MRVGQFQFEFAFLGPQHHRLAFHSADHVEGRARLATQGHLQNVLLDAGLDGLAQLALDFEEAIGRTKPVDALVRPLVVVIFNPELDAFARRIEALELRPGQEVLPDGGPEALDFSERHGMLRTGFDVGHPVLLQLRFETGGAAPTGVLAAIVRQHLPGWFVLGHRLAVDLDDRFGGGTAKEIRSHHEARIIIQEGNQIGIAATQPKGENVRLPHLIGRGPLKEPRPRHIALLSFGRRWHQSGLMELLPHRFGTGAQKEHPPQPLGDPFDAEAGILLFQFDYLSRDWGRQPRFPQ